MPILVNNSPIHTFLFPGGECHVSIEKIPIATETKITASLQNADDILRLLLTVDAVRRKHHTNIHLTIPYFPYARQDRVCNPGEALSAKVMADLINHLHCKTVTILDPHSDVTPALLENCHVITQAEVITKSSLTERIRTENWALIAPDAGAEKKAYDIAKRLSSPDQSVDVYCARKVRNTSNGRIIATTFHDDVTDRKLLIVDDICDGGRTFIELAKVLRGKAAADVRLYITHGIFSKGLEPLRSHLSHIYCANLMAPTDLCDPEFLTIL